MKRIPLRARDGSVKAWTLVDDADYDGLTAHRWKLTAKGYVQREERHEGRWRAVRMHRVLLGLGHGDKRQGDHINGDPLDNRRENLRACEASQQAQNVRRERPGGLPRGVDRLRSGRFQARARLAGRMHYLGVFDTVEQAAAAAASFRVARMPLAA